MKFKFFSNTLAEAALTASPVMPNLGNLKTSQLKHTSNKDIHINKISEETAIVINKHNRPALFNNITSSPVNSYLPIGESLTLINKEGSFYKVKVNKTDSIGYISTSNIKIMESGLNYKFIEKLGHGITINVSSHIILRSQPDSTSKILNTLKNDIEVEILGNQGHWVKIIVNNLIGYIYDTYLYVYNDNNLKLNK